MLNLAKPKRGGEERHLFCKQQKTAWIEREIGFGASFLQILARR